LAHIKHNLSAKQSTLGYRIDHLGLTWTGVVRDLDGERLAGHDPDDQRSALGEAEEFLASMLDAGPRSAGDILTDAKRAGIAEKTLRRARKLLGVTSSKAGFAGGWQWSLPEDGQGAP